MHGRRGDVCAKGRTGKRLAVGAGGRWWPRWDRPPLQSWSGRNGNVRRSSCVLSRYWRGLGDGPRDQAEVRARAALIGRMIPNVPSRASTVDAVWGRTPPASMTAREARTSPRNLRRTQKGSDRSASGRASRGPVFGCLQQLSLKLVATIAQSGNSRACEARVR